MRSGIPSLTLTLMVRLCTSCGRRCMRTENGSYASKKNETRLKNTLSRARAWWNDRNGGRVYCTRPVGSLNLIRQPQKSRLLDKLFGDLLSLQGSSKAAKAAHRKSKRVTRHSSEASQQEPSTALDCEDDDFPTLIQRRFDTFKGEAMRCLHADICQTVLQELPASDSEAQPMEVEEDDAEGLEMEDDAEGSLPPRLEELTGFKERLAATEQSARELMEGFSEKLYSVKKATLSKKGLMKLSSDARIEAFRKKVQDSWDHDNDNESNVADLVHEHVSARLKDMFETYIELMGKELEKRIDKMIEKRLSPDTEHYYIGLRILQLWPHLEAAHYDFFFSVSESKRTRSESNDKAQLQEFQTRVQEFHEQATRVLEAHKAATATPTVLGEHLAEVAVGVGDAYLLRCRELEAIRDEAAEAARAEEEAAQRAREAAAAEAAAAQAAQEARRSPEIPEATLRAEAARREAQAAREAQTRLEQQRQLAAHQRVPDPSEEQRSVFDISDRPLRRDTFLRLRQISAVESYRPDLQYCGDRLRLLEALSNPHRLQLAGQAEAEYELPDDPSGLWSALAHQCYSKKGEQTPAAVARVARALRTVTLFRMSYEATLRHNAGPYGELQRQMLAASSSKGMKEHALKLHLGKHIAGPLEARWFVWNMLKKTVYLWAAKTTEPVFLRTKERNHIDKVYSIVLLTDVPKPASAADATGYYGRFDSAIRPSIGFVDEPGTSSGQRARSKRLREGDDAVDEERERKGKFPERS
mmetsp:Transcript_13762/g.45257  ORF Transcript_13762/g.45257 Transcript_13762/m.45257 type:complete len:756 (-) Transcript_13762:291-2558(-)